MDASTYWHIHVRPTAQAYDGHGRAVLADVHQIGLSSVDGVASSRLYLIRGNLADPHVKMIAESLIADPVVERVAYGPGIAPRDAAEAAIEVHKQAGVMDPVALSARKAMARLLAARCGDGPTVEDVHTARRYEFAGADADEDLERIARLVLANDCVETWYIQGIDRVDVLPETFPEPPTGDDALRHVVLRGLEDRELTRLSRDAHLFLSLEEMQAIRDYFAEQDRDPTDLELETLAQTWSEHCVHKTLKSAVHYHGDDFGRAGTVDVEFDNLLVDTIARATKELDRDWCLSVFVDNAGVVAFDENYGIAFKVETHNHPSAIEPYGGAATGIGGCIRDILGCGLGAKPIASTDVFCVAPPDYPESRLPKDVLHPRRILKGIVSGVRDYGNRMGIPTINGAIHFHDGYLGNPLVFCGCLGLIPRDKIHKQAKPGDRIVVTGGRTGRDGIHGATFSSAELTDTHADEFSHAVQIGNAIEEKIVLDALLLARDHPDGCLFNAVTDCGAGGLSSAVGEMGEEIGAEVELADVPLKYAGLRYDEIWISEAQERMVFAVPPDRLDTFLALCADEEVSATVIGTFTGDKVLRVRFRGAQVGELAMSFMHDGYPQGRRTARWTAAVDDTTVRGDEERFAHVADPAQRLLTALRDWRTASKEWVIRQYDHEVQGRSVVKPLCGPGDGPSDAAVIRPLLTSHAGMALGCGLCPERSVIDPYWMAVSAVDEALRNVICTGADPARTAILDNFCWPKADTDESLGALVRTCQGAYHAAVAYGLPFVSGKDSLNNEFAMGESESLRTGLPMRLAILPTLLISAAGRIDDVRMCITMDLKSADNVLALASAPVDRVGLEAACALHQLVAGLIAEGAVVSAHDVSDGGLAVAIAEMCIAGQLGADVSVDPSLFAEPLLTAVPTTYVLEMSRLAAEQARLTILGTVTTEPTLRIDGDGLSGCVVDVSDLAAAWKSPLAVGGGTA